MQEIKLHPHQIISMNDYSPLHSPDALKRYHDIFQRDNLEMVTPIPVIPVSVAYFFQKSI